MYLKMKYLYCAPTFFLFLLQRLGSDSNYHLYTAGEHFCFQILSPVNINIEIQMLIILVITNNNNFNFNKNNGYNKNLNNKIDIIIKTILSKLNSNLITLMINKFNLFRFFRRFQHRPTCIYSRNSSGTV